MQNTLNILYVGNSRDDIQVLLKIVNAEMLELFTANGEVEALEHLVQYEFIAVLVDSVMPGLNAFEIVEVMRKNERTKSIPIIFVGNKTNGEENLTRKYELGALDEICRPLNPILLHGKLRVVIEAARQKELLLRQLLDARAGFREARLHHRKLAAIFEAAPFAVVAIRWPTGEIIEINSAWEKLFGYSREECIGKTALELDLYLDPAERYRLLEEFTGEAGVRRFASRIRTRSGEERLISQALELVELEGQSYIVGALEDITERSRLERELKSNVARLELLASISSELLNSTNPQRAIRKVCRRAMNHLDCQYFFNFVLDEAVGGLRLNAYSGIPESEANKIEWLDKGQTICGCVARDGVRIIAERIEQSSDPRVALVRSYGVQAYACHPLLREGGKVIGTLSFGTRTRVSFSGEELALMKSITDLVSMALVRIRNELAVRENETRFGLLADNMTQLAWIADHTGAITWFNKRWYEYTGTSFEEMRGWGWKNVQDIRYVEQVEAKYRHHLESGEVWEDTFPLRGADGKFRWFLSRAIPVRDGEGKIRHWFGTNTDIHEQKLLSEKLARGDRLLRTISNYTPGLFFIKDTEGRFQLINHRLEELLGITDSEIQGKTDLDLFSPEIAEGYRAVDFRIMKSGKPEVLEETLTLKGKVYVFLATKFPIYDELGQIYGICGISTDITERKEIESRLQQALTIRDEFMSIASHELKTPLTALKLHTELLGLKLKKEPLSSREMVNTLVLGSHKQISRLNNLIEDLLDVSKIRSGKLSFNPQKLMIRDLVQELADRFRAAFEEARTEFRVIHGTEESANWDRHRIDQALTNFVSNAMKYAPGAAVTLRTTSTSTHARITIEDQGPGIPAEKHAVIFDRYVRSGDARKVPGLGLGLYIAKSVAEGHGGRAFVESIPGAGSTFGLELPLWPASF